MAPRRGFLRNDGDRCQRPHWLSGLGANRKGQPDTHRAKGSGIEPVARDKGRDRLTAQFKVLLPIDNEGPGAALGLAGVASPAAKRRPER